MGLESVPCVALGNTMLSRPVNPETFVCLLIQVCSIAVTAGVPCQDSAHINSMRGFGSELGS